MTTFKALQKFAPVLLATFAVIGVTASPALAESHPEIGKFSTSSNPNSNPNGIAVDESTGDVYVADIGTQTVSKFDASGNPVDFTAGAGIGTNTLTGIPAQSGKPAEAFSFPNLPGTPAAIAVDNSTSPSDPSRGDLYVMDAGDGVIDKFSAGGEYLNQITGFAPATGSSEHELLGLAVDENGTVHVHLSTQLGEHVIVVANEEVTVDEFDDSTANHLVAEQLDIRAGIENNQGVPGEEPLVDGYAVGPSGDSFLLYGGSCSCAAKLGQQLAGLGELDGPGSGDVALAADPATGHVYLDDQSTVSEWDTGAMNGGKVLPFSHQPEAVGTLVSRFGSPQLAGASGQGGIAVDGASGRIYVSDPVAGKGEVYVFASDAPAVTVGAPTSVTKETATLQGTVNPRGEALSGCEFDYGLADEFGRATYEHTVACNQTPSGTIPVAVSANISGLQAGLLYRFRLKAANGSGPSESAGLLATQGEGFGVKSFEVSFVNEDGTPDTQAGSHPYELVNNIEFKSHYVHTESNADSPYYAVPNGTLKRLAVDLPPGLVGDPNATPKKCTLAQLPASFGPDPGAGCPREALLGGFNATWSQHAADGTHFADVLEPVYNMVAARGVALQLGTSLAGNGVIIDNGVLAGGDYPIQAALINPTPEAPVLATRLTVSGVVGEGAARKAFLTLPTGCHGPLRSTISVESYQQPGVLVSKEEVTRNAAGTPVSLTGCSQLKFPPSISVAPDSSDASTSSGLTVNVHVPQTAAFNAEGLAESALRDTTVALPAGVAINPAGGDGLEGCSEGLAGFEAGLGKGGFEEFNPEFESGNLTPLFTPTALESLQPGVSLCPDGSKIGTAKIRVPELEHELEGSVYLAMQNSNPFGSLITMYMLIEDPVSGSTVKLVGEVRLCENAGELLDGVSCQAPGQILTTFKNTPDQPFENLELHFYGGERAPLATPSRCGTYTTQAIFTPWDGNGPVNTSSSFEIEHGPGGGPCPGASLPFNPSLAGGSTNINAGAFTPLTGTFSREDGEQQIARVHFTLPAGLSGLLTGVKLCPEAQANEGTCGPESLIGETTVSAGVGSDPISVKGGRVYLTEKYHGAPFGLSVVNPVKAGPFDLEHDTANPNQDPACDCIVVRARVEIDPHTTALTITSNSESEGYAIPHLIDGVPVQIKKVNFETTRSAFQFNPTSCAKMAISGSVESDEGQSRPVEVPFQATNCATLAFAPKLAVATSGKTSKAKGASLHATLTYPKAPFGSQANIKSVKVDLPKQLPSRLTTLQKACTAKQFDTNPAGCPAASIVGYGKAITPVIPVPLEGPAYFVSNGGEAFPNLIIVLQGYGIKIDLVADTFISKAGVTSSTFKTVPDQPVTSFELTLPEGKYSALAANGNLCAPTSTVTTKKKETVKVKGRKRTVTRKVKETKPASLAMPTSFVAQNGAEIHESTPISVTGCAKTRPAKKKKAKKHKKGGHKK